MTGEPRRSRVGAIALLVGIGLALLAIVVVMTLSTSDEDASRVDQAAPTAVSEGSEDARDEQAPEQQDSGASPTDVSSSSSAPTTTSGSVDTVSTTAVDPFESDAALIMDLYAQWSRAVSNGQATIEAYFADHLYPDLPKCASGEKVLPHYTAQRETIARADRWTISWGPLDGVRPAGRVYEVQLAEGTSKSHVTILNGVAYVFWNCKG